MSLQNPIRLFREGLGNTIYGSPPGSGAGGGVAAVAANNGLMVAGTATNPIVQLGQPVGALGDPAKMIRDSQIPMNGFGIQFVGATHNDLIDSDGTFEIGGPSSANAVQTFIYLPNNYGQAYPGHGRGGGFFQGWQRFDGVNTYPRPNVVGMLWGYNVGLGGSPIFADEAAFRYGTETDFDLNFAGSDTFELHFPEVTVPSGLVERLWSFYTDKTTGSTIHQSQIQNFNFNTKNDNLTYYGWSATTVGSPTTDLTVHFVTSGRGSGAMISSVWNDLDNTFDNFSMILDRGSMSFNLAGTGGSLTNHCFNFNGSASVTGVAGVNFWNVFGNADQITEFSVRMNAPAPSTNNPSYVFDRRVAGSFEIGNGNNGGELTWGGGARVAQLKGIANGALAGITSLFDLEFEALDLDGLEHVNMIVGRDGTLQVPRGTITTADPGSGAGAWLLGIMHATAITVDLTKYIEVNIGGTVFKLVTAN